MNEKHTHIKGPVKDRQIVDLPEGTFELTVYYCFGNDHTYTERRQISKPNLENIGKRGRPRRIMRPH